MLTFLTLLALWPQPLLCMQYDEDANLIIFAEYRGPRARRGHLQPCNGGNYGWERRGGGRGGTPAPAGVVASRGERRAGRVWEGGGCDLETGGGK